METSLKTGFAQIFSCCPKKSELPKIWGGCSPPRPPGPYAYAGSQEFNSFQKFTVFSNQKGFAKYVSRENYITILLSIYEKHIGIKELVASRFEEF